MTRKTKTWLVIATSLIVLGSFIFVGVMSILKWDFSKLSTAKYEDNVTVITQSFEDVYIQTDTADVEFVPSQDGQITVACHEESKIKHSVTVEDGTLKIQRTDTRKWFEKIGISFGTTKIIVKIPGGLYGALKINLSTGDTQISNAFTFESVEISQSTGDAVCYAKVQDFIKVISSTGDIRLENLSASAIDLTVSTGEITLKNVACANDLNIKVSTGETVMTNVTCKNLISNGDTGDITLNNVIASNTFNLERDTGDVTFNRCDAGEICVQTSTGDVEGSLLSSKIFFVETDTGRKRVPQSMVGGRCEITTSTGDIEITIVQ